MDINQLNKTYADEYITRQQWEYSMKKPHKHAELIKAWADGATIEHNNGLGYWVEQKNPQWNTWDIYRIKPEPKPDVVICEHLRSVEDYTSPCGYSIMVDCNRDNNIIYIFDGETGKLKSAEVLK